MAARLYGQEAVVSFLDVDSTTPVGGGPFCFADVESSKVEITRWSFLLSRNDPNYITLPI
jgi:hypothetical protein